MEDGSLMNSILYEDNHIIVVEKKINVPVQADASGDKDLVTIIKEYLKDKYNKPGNVYLGLVHRLDRPVGGVMVFAKTSKSAARLSEQMRVKDIKKKYYAVLEGCTKENDTLIDYLYNDDKTNMVVIDKKGKEAILSYRKIKTINNLTLVEITLKTGRKHQIRVQFSSRGLPLWGDQRYNKNAQVGEQIALFSYYLSFNHPTKKERLEFKLDLPKRRPFNIFSEE